MLREARRAALSPILLVACAVAGWTMWGDWINGQPPPNEWGSDVYLSLFYTAWPLLWGSFLLGAWTLARERPETTQELFTAAPLSAWQRTAARLAVAAVPAMAAVLVVGVQAFLVARAGGVPLGYPPYRVHVMPSLVEWASIPVAAFASYVGGAAAYTVTRSRTFTALIGTFVTIFGVLPLLGHHRAAGLLRHPHRRPGSRARPHALRDAVELRRALHPRRAGPTSRRGDCSTPTRHSTLPTASRC